MLICGEEDSEQDRTGNRTRDRTGHDMGTGQERGQDRTEDRTGQDRTGQDIIVVECYDGLKKNTYKCVYISGPKRSPDMILIAFLTQIHD